MDLIPSSLTLVVASGCLLLHQKKPLFNRFISMSGNTLMLRPLPSPLTEFVYSTIMQSLGLGPISGAERVKALLQIPVEKIVEAGNSGLPILPAVDGDSVPCYPTFAQLGSEAEDPSLSMPGRTWCKELLIGDCQFDVSHPEFQDINTAETVARDPFCRSCLVIEDLESPKHFALPSIGHLLYNLQQQRNFGTPTISHPTSKIRLHFATSCDLPPISASLQPV